MADLGKDLGKTSSQKQKSKQKELMAECELRGIEVDNTMDRLELERRLMRYFEEEEAEASERGGGATGGGETGGLAGDGRLMPSWTPPGVVFPLMWVGVVAPLRAAHAQHTHKSTRTRRHAHADT